jgi:hypothetical protein
VYIVIYQVGIHPGRNGAEEKAQAEGTDKNALG